MIAAAADDATQGRDVGEVAAQGDADIVGGGLAVVGGVELHPAVDRAPHGHPGVRGIGADELFFAGLGMRAQVAADVARGQPEAAQGGNHDVRIVLADAGAQFERLRGAGLHFGALGVVGEVGVDALHQVEGAAEQRLLGRKAGGGVGGCGGKQGGEMGAEGELGLGDIGLADAVEQLFAHLFPRRTGVPVGRLGRAHLHQADGAHGQRVMRAVVGEELTLVAEHIDIAVPMFGLGVNVADVVDAFLRGVIERAEVRQMVGQLDRGGVGVGGFVHHAVEHGVSLRGRSDLGHACGFQYPPSVRSGRLAWAK